MFCCARFYHRIVSVSQSASGRLMLRALSRCVGLVMHAKVRLFFEPLLRKNVMFGIVTRFRCWHNLFIPRLHHSFAFFTCLLIPRLSTKIDENLTNESKQTETQASRQDFLQEDVKISVCNRNLPTKSSKTNTPERANGNCLGKDLGQKHRSESLHAKVEAQQFHFPSLHDFTMCCERVWWMLPQHTNRGKCRHAIGRLHFDFASD